MDKRIITRNFSRYAFLYDKYADVQFKAAKELICSVDRNGFKSILEIGCGTGNYTLLLREKFKAARIRAVDISKEMVGVARGKLENSGIEFEVGDSENILSDEKFDFVTSNACFQWFDDLEKALVNFKDALKARGVISFSIFGPLTLWEFNSALKSALGEVAFAADNFITRQKIEKMLGANFKEIGIREIKYEESFADLNSLLHKIKYTGVRGNGLADKFSFNRGILRKVENIYLEKFGGIKATFQVFFCQGSA